MTCSSLTFIPRKHRIDCVSNWYVPSTLLCCMLWLELSCRLLWRRDVVTETTRETHCKPENVHLKKEDNRERDAEGYAMQYTLHWSITESSQTKQKSSCFFDVVSVCFSNCWCISRTIDANLKGNRLNVTSNGILQHPKNVHALKDRCIHAAYICLMSWCCAVQMVFKVELKSVWFRRKDKSFHGFLHGVTGHVMMMWTMKFLREIDKLLQHNFERKKERQCIVESGDWNDFIADTHLTLWRTMSFIFLFSGTGSRGWRWRQELEGHVHRIPCHCDHHVLHCDCNHDLDSK